MLMIKKLTPLFRKFLVFFLLVAPAISFAQPAQFNSSSNSGCAPLTVSFYNSSPGGGVYTWNFGDPASGPYDSSMACSPTHTFASAGVYTVTLSYTVNATTYTATSSITVYPKPNPVISGKDTLCEGESISYTVAGSPGSTYYWTIIGGSIVGPNNLSTVNVDWNMPGTGILTVEETTVNGCKNTSKINILVANQPEIGNFCDLKRQGGSAGGNGKESTSCLCQNNISQIQAIGSNGLIMPNSLFNFQWTVLSGGSVFSGGNTNTAQIAVGSGPTITIQLVAWNDFGCRDTQICVFDVCTSPIASAKADTACFKGTTHFNASASAIASQIVNYHWNFGDLSQSSGVTPFATHTYAASGTYNVTLTVTYANGCKDDTTFQVLVNEGNPPPIECPGTVCHGIRHCYSTPYYPGTVYNWTVTGGIGTPNANGDSICVTWGNGPSGNITLNVTGGPYTCGYNSVDIPIFPANLQISGPDTACAGSVVQFSVPLIPGSCYSWSPTNPNITIATNSGNIINVSIPPNVSGTFFVAADVYNDITCCEEKDSFYFVVQPAIIVDTIQSTCEFSSKIYSSNFPVNWSVSGAVSYSSTPTSLTVNWGAAGTGTITATAQNPALVCNDVVTFSVQLLPLPPNPPINGPTMVCVGSVVNYNYINHPNIAGSSWSISPAATMTATGNNANIVFSTPGSYTITTQYFNNNYNFSGLFNCYSSSTLNVLVVDTACPVITGPDSSCTGATATYTLSSNPGNIWQWQIVGGNIVSQTSTTITVQWGNISAGQINIQNNLCNGFCSKIVPVRAIPVGAITRGDSTCKGDSIRLTGPPGYTYSWSTGATSQSIWVTTAGSYSLTISQLGCSTTIVQNLNPIPKKPKPNVNISWSCMASPSLPVPYMMTATYNPLWSYSWSPQTSTPANADTTNTHFSTVFNSTHTVIATNEYGCKDTASVTLNQSCVITGGGGGGGTCSCAPSISVSYDPCTGQFTANVSGQPYSVVYWDFTDGDFSNQLNPQHWFSDTGYYNVVFAVYCTSGCWTYYKATTYVPYILRPKIKHSFPISCNYNYVQLSYKPTSVIKGLGISYSTDWGDGSPLTSGALTQNHTYSTAGTYIISHTVSVPGCSKTVYDTVTILPFQALFSYCDSGCINQSLQFVDQSLSSVPIVNWSWNFGDGNVSNLQSPFHVYSATGAYTVQLIIQNQQGCKDTFVSTINITTFNAGSLLFTTNGNPAAGPILKICDGGYVTATAPFNINYTYAWSDGAFGNVDTITKSGVYWVTVTNGNGCKHKLGPFTVIVNPNPNATILSPDSACAGSSLVLTGLSGLGYTYNWNLNNGAYTDSVNPVQFSGVPAGVYTTVLTVTNAFGCVDYDTLNLTLLQGPIVTVSPGYTAVCAGNPVTLTASVAGPFTSFSWSNGAVTPSITVISTGNYVATAIDANGCAGSNSGYVQVHALPDLSNIPKGCYKVCTSKGAVKVCGPIPMWYENFQYTWLQNGVPVATTQNYSITASGNYQLIVVNANTGCADTSEVFSLQYVPGPVSNIGSGSPNPTICKGSNACITLVVNNPQDDIVYNWYASGSPTEEPIIVGEGDTIVICDPGVYILESFMSNCCKSYDTIVIEEGDCCFDLTDSDFHLIQDSTVYTTNQWWDGKYFVAGRVYVRNKAILDMTTIDVVFDRDGEIIFEDSSIVRANNSVFRPCDMHDVWVGFTFKDSSSGFIHTSLFKNAKHAIDVRTTGTEGVKITDNTFTNCHIGVRVDRSGLSYNHGITKNSFVIDNYDFTVNSLYPTYDYFGIIIRSVNMQEIVSQNDFRNSDRFKQQNRFYGIYLQRSKANFSENKFSNMYRGIDVVSANGLVNIENNEFEKTWRLGFPSDVQIRMSDCQVPVLVFANELRNSDDAYTGSTGIFAERMYGLNIRDNNIKGFDIGIRSRRLQSSVINENDIDLAGDIGILDSFSRSTDINCNIVRMKDCRKGLQNFCNSIGIYMQAGNNSNNIFTNCVFDTRRAISLASNVPGGGVPVPNVVNNYLYNYLVAGVNVTGHTGGIGFAGQPGRNTFVSNNHGGGARDIVASPLFTITEQCNNGIILNGPGVITSNCPPNTMYSSTAACGQLIVNHKYYKQDKWDICDPYTGKGIVIVIDHGGTGIGIDKDKLASANLVPMPKEEMMLVATMLAESKNKVDFDLWCNRIQSHISTYEYRKLQAVWLKSNSDLAGALAALQNAPTTSEEENQDKLVTMIAWQKSSNVALTASEKAVLTNIDNAETSISAQARDLIQGFEGNHDYRFGGYSVDPEQVVPDLKEGGYIKVVPNPAVSSAVIEFSQDGEDDAIITITDMAGNKVFASVVRISAGSYQVDLRNLATGIYLVNVFDTENNAKHVTKLLKQ